MQRRTIIAAAVLAPLAARAHHGWSSFDQNRPLYLQGKVLKSAWRNPHAELELEVDANPSLPADLAQRTLPAQMASIDGPKLLAATQLPTRKDRVWQIELAPLTRMNAWGVPEIKAGDRVAMIGFTFNGEKGDPVLRVEYLFAGGQAYGLRSSPA